MPLARTPPARPPGASDPRLRICAADARRRAEEDSRHRARLLAAHRHTGGGVGVERVQRLGPQQRLGEALELLAMVAEQAGDLLVRSLDEAAHLLVDQPAS